MARYVCKRRGSNKNPPSLTIHYSDGSSQTITAQPYEGIKENPELRDVDLYEKREFQFSIQDGFSRRIFRVCKGIGKRKGKCYEFVP